MTDHLFSPAPLTERESHDSPVIVVGLPRSGSSFLSDILGQIGGWYVFDDLYLRDKSREIGAKGPLNDEQLDKLLYFLGWQIRARLRFGRYAIPAMIQEEVDPMNAAIKVALRGREADWLDLQKEWMVRLAVRAGCQNWGYKLPKAFRDLSQLRARYPGMKVVFMLRNPGDVLRSYKFMPADHQDGRPDRYHPLLYAIYWRLSARAAEQELAARPDGVRLVRFHDLVADPLAVARELAEFLGEGPVEAVQAPEQPNSSFKDRGARKELTGLELWLVHLICGGPARRLGFRTLPGRVRLVDLADFFRVSGRYLRFIMTRGKKK